MAVARNNTKSKSSLFLLELAVAIVFFALAAVICIQLFVKAHVLSRESGELNMAMIQAQSVAEVYKAAKGDSEKLSQLLAEDIGGNGSSYICFLYFNSEWERVYSPNEAAYMILVHSESGRNLHSASIGVCPLVEGTDVLRPIYVLNVKAYTGLEAAL